MARMIAVVSMKGGSGKSTVAMILAELLALGSDSRAPRRVLALDLDPQASLTAMLMGTAAVAELRETSKTINQAISSLADGHPLGSAANYIRTDASGMKLPEPKQGRRQGCVDLIAAKPGIRFDELRLEWNLAQKSASLWHSGSVVAKSLKEFLSEVSIDYDDIIIDCPPSLTVLAQATLRLADLMVSPIVPEHASYWSALNFLKTLVRADPEDENAFIDRSKIMAIINKSRGTVGSHQSSAMEIRDALKKSSIKVAPDPIPLADSITKAAERGGKGQQKPRSPREKYGRELVRLQRIVNYIHQSTPERSA